MGEIYFFKNCWKTIIESPWKQGVVRLEVDDVHYLNGLSIHVTIQISNYVQYSNHLNTRLVWCSNGRFVSGCQMVVWKPDWKKACLWSKMSGIQIVHQVTWLNHLNTGHPVFNIQMVTVVHYWNDSVFRRAIIQIPTVPGMSSLTSDDDRPEANSQADSRLWKVRSARSKFPSW